ncbi:DUF1990 domain-containing protein [Micromonospora sp. KC207]|uniref:DUF1990 family protein n=1 Tax=Micromonospora sp. KC207 TaxID=2530377 RepID=UPI001046E04B|nr:DUF1990 domain-containing protein [Micromonospora sp. KC207]TDC65555.1 DUF1990 domain-containing protein [Micromonospora sp. KC207]
MIRRRPASLDELPGRDFTYSNPGTAGREPRRGYRHISLVEAIGLGDVSFNKASEALLGLEMHRRAGLAVSSSAIPVSVGANVLLELPVTGFHIQAPCRIVYVINDRHANGFAYGTLSGHPESGEEEFVVTRDLDNRVWFSIRAFSRPSSRLLRLAEPLSHLAQRAMTLRYLSALRSIANSP